MVDIYLVEIKKMLKSIDIYNIRFLVNHMTDLCYMSTVCHP